MHFMKYFYKSQKLRKSEKLKNIHRELIILSKNNKYREKKTTQKNMVL